MVIKVIGERDMWKKSRPDTLLRKSIAELSHINARESEFFFTTFQVYFVNKLVPSQGSEMIEGTRKIFRKHKAEKNSRIMKLNTEF